jgi:Transposase DDE domain/Transposase DNA-binding
MSVEIQRCHRWAYETFCGVQVGSLRRRRRVVQLAAAVAMRPAGTVTHVCSDSADREGAYRLLSNDGVPAAELTRAMCAATAQQCAGQERVYVVVDGTSLSLRDSKGIRGVGGVGAWKDFGRGLQVMTALALDASGTPIGVCAQTWWARQHVVNLRRCLRRKVPEKETRYALDALQSALGHLKEACPETCAVAVMDRGFDCWPVLQTAAQGARFIVRARPLRRLQDGPGGGRRYLLQVLRSQPVLGRYQIRVPARENRPERLARMQVRTARVTLRLRVGKTRVAHQPLNALWAVEQGGPKDGALSWLLLTTEPIDTFAQVLEIVRAYTLRWRIEELHRIWKRGGGHVEDTQLRSREAIVKWATLHVAVAARALRLSQLARSKPEISAAEEFSQLEIDAAIALRRKRTQLHFGDVPSLAEVVRLIADIGGYTGKSSGGPPGPTVIARGLQRLAIAAEVLESTRK